MKYTADSVIKELKKLGNPVGVQSTARFFKTEKGGYGFGDVFLGCTVPVQRSVSKKYKTLPLSEIKKLLGNTYHDCRLTALFILVMQYQKGTPKEKAAIAKFYLANRSGVNNWDLVDASAHHILGDYLFDKSRASLLKLARSRSLWDRRIAIVSTLAFIRKGELSDTFRISTILLKDTHDLIHKATGWMLREAGKKSTPELERFLKKHAATMPRTMLRYAIEKFPERKRNMYRAIRYL